MPILALIAEASAHDFAPAVLHLDEVRPGAFVASVDPGKALEGATIDHLDAVVACPLAADGTWTCGEGPSAAGLEGLAHAVTDGVVIVRRLDGSTVTATLTAEAPIATLGGGPEARGDYFRIGVEHVLGGADHLLFVFVLALASPRVVWAVTAFTVGHSITLAAAALGMPMPAQAPVEVLIAWSIAVVAAAHCRGTGVAPSPRVALGFGLLHGLGFGGALRDLGVPAADLPAALLGFNLGVEAGQLVFLAVAWAPIAWITRKGRDKSAAWLAGALAATWTFFRLAGSLS